MAGRSRSCIASCHLAYVRDQFRGLESRWPVLLTWEYCEGISDGRHIDPTLIVFLQARSALLPVCVGLALVGRADEESSDIILSSNDQQTVVGVTSDTTACLSFPVRLVRGRESESLVSYYTLSNGSSGSRAYRSILMWCQPSCVYCSKEPWGTPRPSSVKARSFSPDSPR